MGYYLYGPNISIYFVINTLLVIQIHKKSNNNSISPFFNVSPYWTVWWRDEFLAPAGGSNPARHSSTLK